MASVIPENRARFTLAELVGITSAERKTPEASGAEEAIIGVSTDSRGALAGALFVALRGERFDGHRFAQAAVDAGARALLVEDEVSVQGAAEVLRVPSTLAALGALARHHRRRWGGRVVAVAGSVGKTTTRSATAALLAAAGERVHSPRGNLNNRVGVPMVLLALEPEQRTAVVEIGTNAPGEVGLLTAIAEPDVGVLTRVSLEHSEGLGDLDAIELEEGSLFAWLTASGVAVANGDDERCLRRLAASPAGTKLRFGAVEGVDYRILEASTESPRASRVRLARPVGGALGFSSPLLGAPGAYAMAAAVAVSERLLARPLALSEVERALASPALGEPGRLSPVELADGSLVLDDTYNASPASVLSSAELARELAARRGRRLVLVLGEMRELGPLSEAAHRDVGRALCAAHPALLIAFGGDARQLAEATAASGIDARFVDDAPAALALLERLRAAGDVILVKASRGLYAERIVQGLSGGGGGS